MNSTHDTIYILTIRTNAGRNERLHKYNIVHLFNYLRQCNPNFVRSWNIIRDSDRVIIAQSK